MSIGGLQQSKQTNRQATATTNKKRLHKGSLYVLKIHQNQTTVYIRYTAP